MVKESNDPCRRAAISAIAEMNPGKNSGPRGDSSPFLSRALQPTEPQSRTLGARQIVNGVNLGYICFVRFQERCLLYLN